MPAKTTIIIPALNEGPVIGAVVRQIAQCLPLIAAGITDVLVIDNGSDDDTAVQALAAGARVVREPRRGYGRACLAGVLAAADAEIIVQIDGDGSDVPEDILRVWEPVAAGQADLAMGSRARGRAERGALTPQQRVGNAVGALALRTLYGVRVTDLGPLRAYRRTIALDLAMREMTYGWSTEQLAKAGRSGLRVVEIPVAYRRRAGGASKVAGTLSGTLRASGRILRTLASYTRWSPPPLAAPERAALFIVARLPIPGQTKTRLAAGIGPQSATDLYAAFLRDLDDRFGAAGASEGYDLCWFVSLPPGRDLDAFRAFAPSGQLYLRQADEADLGTRLWQGFTALNARGYQRIVVLGSDSPHIPAAAVRAAFQVLDTVPAVIGPAADGGYYLLGQRGTPHDLFTSVPMSTPEVYARTLTCAASLGLTLGHIPDSFDVDALADLDRLQAALRMAPSGTADPAPATLARLDQIWASTAIGEHAG